MLGSFGVPRAERCTLVPVCITWLPCGYRGCGIDCFGCVLGLLGFPLHIGV